MPAAQQDILTVVLNMWREVLRRAEAVNPDEDFFMAGGTSLLAVKLVFRLQEVLHMDLSPSLFANSPTPASMALHIENLKREASQDGTARYTGVI